jgi:hypothetical protein
MSETKSTVSYLWQLIFIDWNRPQSQKVTSLFVEWSIWETDALQTYIVDDKGL